ncbi:MAG: acyl carrier protein [Spirulina sp. SIO3F2]|nr:acyl carrier protein [Spirulina sp. SIO3F2]
MPAKKNKFQTVKMGLDAVELVLAWEEAFDITIGEEDAEEIQTPAMAIAYIAKKLNASSSVIGVCPTLRAFHFVCQVLRSQLNLFRHQVCLDSRLNQLIPRDQRREVSQAIGAELKISRLPNSIPNWTMCISTVQELVDWLVTNYPQEFVDGQWTHNQIRSIVRAVIRNQMEVRYFSDDVDLQREFA